MTVVGKIHMLLPSELQTVIINIKNVNIVTEEYYLHYCTIYSSQAFKITTLLKYIHTISLPIYSNFWAIKIFTYFPESSVPY